MTLDHAFRSLALLVTLTALGGCSFIKKPALKAVAGALTGEGSAVTAHNDPETVREALGFALITNESILVSIPKHEPLLTATCSQYTQYAAGFLQPEAERLQFTDYEKSKPIAQRAFRLADRGRGFCWRALEVRWEGVTERLKADPSDALRKAKRDQVPLLYWSAASLAVR